MTKCNGVKKVHLLPIFAQFLGGKGNYWNTEGGYPGKKISSYLDIVKIVLNPPPVLLETYKELFKRPKSAEKESLSCTNLGKNKVPQKFWILVNPLPPWKNVQIQVEKCPSNNLDSGMIPHPFGQWAVFFLPETFPLCFINCPPLLKSCSTLYTDKLLNTNFWS